MKMDDFILIRFLWQFEALRQVNKKTTSKYDELTGDRTLPATGDFRTIRHDKELKQDYGNKAYTKPINLSTFYSSVQQFFCKMI